MKTAFPAVSISQLSAVRETVFAEVDWTRTKSARVETFMIFYFMTANRWLVIMKPVNKPLFCSCLHTVAAIWWPRQWPTSNSKSKPPVNPVGWLWMWIRVRSTLFISWRTCTTISEFCIILVYFSFCFFVGRRNPSHVSEDTVKSPAKDFHFRAILRAIVNIP